MEKKAKSIVKISKSPNALIVMPNLMDYSGERVCRIRASVHAGQFEEFANSKSEIGSSKSNYEKTAQILYDSSQAKDGDVTDGSTGHYSFAGRYRDSNGKLGAWY